LNLLEDQRSYFLKMFFSQFILTKKGPLGRVWIAAHMDRKLSKIHIFQTNIPQAIEGIVSPPVPMALRLSGQLLLGVVRIYSRKVKYLLTDCSEAMVKIKAAFRPGVVDLPADATFSFAAVTLPENLEDFEIRFVPDVIMEVAPAYDQFVSKREAITMKEPAFPSFLEAISREPEEQFAVPDNEDWLEAGAKEMPTPEVPRRAADLETAEVSRRMADDGAGVGFGAPEDVNMAGPEFEAMDFEIPDMRPEPEKEGLVPAETPATPAAAPTPITPGVLEMNFETPSVRVKRATKRRKLLVDGATELAGDRIKAQLGDTSDIVKDHGVPTLDGEAEVEVVDVDHVFNFPLTSGMAPQLLELFARNLKPQAKDAVTPQKAAQETEKLGVKTAPRTEVQAPKDAADVVPEPDADEPAPDAPPPDADENIVVPEDHAMPEDAQGEGEKPEEPAQLPEVQEEEAAEGPQEVKHSFSTRTVKMLSFLQKAFDEAETLAGKKAQLNFNDTVRGKKRRTAAGCFFEVLVLNTRGYINVNQQEPYGDIFISKMDKFYESPQISQPSQLIAA